MYRERYRSWVTAGNAWVAGYEQTKELQRVIILNVVEISEHDMLEAEVGGVKGVNQGSSILVQMGGRV